ncbi:MAG TPA: hypothetical protein VI544_00480 [Candidatus Nanoarchaeia archaeon]|nr:hypothetical protein [Candidatus Nanoarchaeia archaeon]
MKITQDIKKGKLHSAYAVGAFDEAKEALEREGYRVISLEEQAGLRIQEGANSGVSQRGNWTREGFLYVPNKGAFLTKNSPVMANAKRATDCHRKGREFYLTSEQVEISIITSVKVTDTKIPTNRLADEALTQFAFGKNAEAYGEFLKENGIDSIEVYFGSSGNKAFARQVRLCGIDDDESELEGNGNFCYGISEVRGVRASAGSKGTSHAQKSAKSRIKAYTLKDIQRALKTLKLSGLESQILETLKN